MIAPSENTELAKPLANIFAKPAEDPIRNVCTTIAYSLEFTGIFPKLHFIVTTNNIEVKLLNNEAITALRFEIEFDSTFIYRTPELHAMVQRFNTDINFQKNILTFNLMDIEEKGIMPGGETILSIPFISGKSFKVTKAYASSRTNELRKIEYTISNDNSLDNLIVLERNDPNPFSTFTKIEFQTSERCEVRVIIYDIDGALIRTLIDRDLKAGIHKVSWDGKDDSGNVVEPGVYLYKLYAGVYSLTKKMVFIKGPFL